MHALALTLALLAAPFWEARSPREWTEEELRLLLSDSPWAQSQGAQMYLATAQPMMEAEAELKRRTRRPSDPQGPLEEEYLEFLRENAGKYIVLAVRLPDVNALADAEESRRMEEDCIMKAGRRKHKMVGHFPPTPSDPYLRLVFPRDVTAEDRHLDFELYLPSVPKAYRMVQFDLKEMSYKGKLEL